MSAVLAARTMTRAERVSAAAVIIRDAAEDVLFERQAMAELADDEKKPAGATAGQNKD